MKKSEFLEIIEKMYDFIEGQIPKYMANKEDSSISDGNVDLCMIDKEAQVYGKMYGKDAVRRRAFYRIAWIKASQVWITREKTGKFEELVFAGKLDDKRFGIKRPDFIGWEGGQLIKLGNIDFAVGFSGFRGINDLEIVVDTAKEAIKHGPTKP